ncbi:MAG: TetR/AcrR family transcriptional regulator [Propionicimonas sp.]|uniref:TetR/AcrR family transcriptional regulator n=1 Tax=Propionicimonas sp. TaxID=1955623 RepID=UPI003D0ED0D3
MPAHATPHNRGPAAAAENRAAILAAARRLFAEQGYHVPLNAIAKAAGVGQGVLYRHFPDRGALAGAVFKDNFVELEQLAAATPGPDCFGVLWRRIVAYSVASSAFVEMVIDARTQLPSDVSEERLIALVAEPLARAQAAGLADPAWTPGDILLVEHMLHGVVIAQLDPADTMDAVRRALALIDPRLADLD